MLAFASSWALRNPFTRPIAEAIRGVSRDIGGALSAAAGGPDNNGQCGSEELDDWADELDNSRDPPLTFPDWNDPEEFDSWGGPGYNSSILTARPIVGVVAIPGGPAPEGWSYIAASYVKFLEQGGVRVAPILYDESRER